MMDARNAGMVRRGGVIGTDNREALWDRTSTRGASGTFLATHADRTLNSIAGRETDSRMLIRDDHSKPFGLPIADIGRRLFRCFTDGKTVEATVAECHKEGATFVTGKLVEEYFDQLSKLRDKWTGRLKREQERE